MKETTRAAVGAPSFIRQEVYVDAILAAVRLRLRGAVEGALLGDATPQQARDEEELEIHAAARASAAAGIAMPLLWLGDRLSLTATEQRTLFVLLAHELDPTSRQLLRDLNTEQVADPTLDAIRRVVYGDAAQVRAGIELGPDGPLRRLQLIERTDVNERCPDYRQTFAISRRVVALAVGDTQLDPSLAGLASAAASANTRDHLVCSSAVVDRVASALSGPPGLIVVSGRHGSGRRSLLTALAHEQHYDVIEVDCRAISTTRDAARRQLQTIARELVTLRRIALLCHLEALTGSGDVPDRLDLVENELSGLVLATTTRPLARRWRRAPTMIEITSPTGAELAQLWARAIPEATDGDVELMATMYPFTPALIVAAGEIAHRDRRARCSRRSSRRTGDARTSHAILGRHRSNR